MVVALMLCGLYSFNQAKKAYDNIFNQLGLDTEEAQSYITSNLYGASTTFPRTKIMAKLALNKREEAIKEIGNYIKAYVKSPEFAKEYQTARLELKPQKPEGLYENEENMAAYKEDLKLWEAEYPTAFNSLLKKRLTHFLQLSADITYNAKLEKYGSKMIFSDPALEAKDEFWKACFRAGKPTVDAARAFAKQWLLELK